MGSSAYADLNLPKRLSNHQRTQAHQHPDVISAQKEKDILAQRPKDDYDFIKNGSKSLNDMQHTRVQSKLRALKLRVKREAFTKLLRDFHSVADLKHMMTQLNEQESTFKMLTSVPHVLKKRRQLAHELFQSATESSFAQMIDIMTRLCSFFEDKDQRCSSHEGDTTDQINMSHACAQLSSATVDEPVHSTDSIDLTLNLDGAESSEDARLTKPVKSAKSRKLVASSKITKTNKQTTHFPDVSLLLRQPEA